MIRAACDSNAGAKVEFPVRTEIDVDGRKKRLLLVAQWIETGDGAKRPIILETEGDLLGDVVAHLHVWREGHPFAYFEAVEGTIHGGIESQVPAAQLFVDDRPDLPG